jgi:hypothetical protein
VSNIYLSHCVSDTTLFSGFWCSYHCKTFVCSNCHVLSYPYTSVSFSQISNFQNIFTILDCAAVLFTIFRFLLMFNLNCVSRYIPRYTFSWLVKPMWLVISMKNFLLTFSDLDSEFL